MIIGEYRPSTVPGKVDPPPYDDSKPSLAVLIYGILAKERTGQMRTDDIEKVMHLWYRKPENKVPQNQGVRRALCDKDFFINEGNHLWRILTAGERYPLKKVPLEKKGKRPLEEGVSDQARSKKRKKEEYPRDGAAGSACF